MNMYTYKVKNFDLDKIYESGQVFRWELIGGNYFISSGKNACQVFTDKDKKYINIICESQEKEFWEYYFGINDNYNEYWRILNLWAERDGEDSYLSKAIKAGNGMGVLNQPVWETAISFIVSQNNNIPRIKNTIKKMCEKLGDCIETDEGYFYYTFPEPQNLCNIENLQGLGIGYRDKYISDFARRVLDNKIDLDVLRIMPFKEAKCILKSCPGIGEKVANCILLYGCGHLEAFPVDTWIRRVLDREFPNGFPYERYSRFLGLVQQIIFYYERMLNK